MKIDLGINRAGGIYKAVEFRAKSQIQGGYFEFGVYQGLSLVWAMDANNKYTNKLRSDSLTQFVAFDSFKGLPAPTSKDILSGYDVFKEGQYACSLKDVKANIKKNNQDPDEILFVEGFYEQSLSRPETRKALKGSKAAIVHIDCDLYSSAKVCLDFVKDYLVDGAVCLFDDWFCFRGRDDQGVQLAFRQWLEQNSWKATEYYRYGWAGIAFILHDKGLE